MQIDLSKFEPLAYLAAKAILAAAVCYGAWMVVRPYLVPIMGNPFGSSVVTFDVVKLANAQRAVASAFIKPDGAPPDVAVSLMSMQKATRQAIDEVAGPGTVVLVKQAVVSNHLPDITDAVLRQLGLPTNVPTQNATSYTLDDAPTYLSLLPPKAPQPSTLPSNEKVVP